jgi:copper chaperone CopZ
MQTKLNVEGMMCSHCESSVKKAVSAISGVTDVSFDDAATTEIDTHNESVDVACIKSEIEEQGYDVI